MRKIWFVPFLVASALVLIVCFVQGGSAIVFPLSLTLSFFAGYLIMGFRASLQAELNPGLEKLEPSFWSSVYDGWLWVTDRKRWKVYALSFSCIMGAILGTIWGFALLLLFKKISFSTLGTHLTSWTSGIFLMLTIAILIARK
jgi:hypothetical protein